MRQRPLVGARAQLRLRVATLSASRQRALSRLMDNLAKVWSVARGECVTTNDLGEWVRGVALAEGGTVVSGNDGGKAEVWRIDGGATIHTLRHPLAVTAVAAVQALAPAGRPPAQGVRLHVYSDVDGAIH